MGLGEGSGWEIFPFTPLLRSQQHKIFRNVNDCILSCSVLFVSGCFPDFFINMYVVCGISYTVVTHTRTHIHTQVGPLGLYTCHCCKNFAGYFIQYCSNLLKVHNSRITNILRRLMVKSFQISQRTCGQRKFFNLQ